MPVPSKLRREVYDRDEGRCTSAPDGVRCNTPHRLKLHRWVAVAHGGTNTSSNLTLHFGPYNRYQAVLDGLPMLNEVLKAWT